MRFLKMQCAFYVRENQLQNHKIMEMLKIFRLDQKARSIRIHCVLVISKYTF